jgi:hypothetical protein
MRRFPMRARCILVVFAALSIAGCTRWQMESSPAGLAERKPKAVRAERLDGTVVELVRVEQVDDSLTGLVPHSAPAGAPLQRVTLPVDEIARVASKRSDTRRTIIAVVAAPLAYLASSFMVRW